MKYQPPVFPNLRYVPHPTYIPKGSTPKHMPPPRDDVKYFSAFEIMPVLPFGGVLNTYRFVGGSTHWGYEIKSAEHRPGPHVLLLGPDVEPGNKQDFAIVPRGLVVKTEIDYHNVFTGFDDPRYIAVLNGEPFGGIHPKSNVN